MTEETFEELEPEWICRRKNGGAIRGPRGVHLDITGGYRGIV